MKKFWNKSSLFKKCACICIVCITIPTLFFAFFLYHTQSKQLYEQVIHDRKTALHQITDNVNTNFMAVENLSNDLTYRNVLVPLVSRSDLNKYPVWTKHASEEVMINLKYSLKYQNLSILNAAIFTNNPDMPKAECFYSRDKLYTLSFYQDFRNQNKNYDIYFLPEEDAQDYFSAKGEKTETKGPVLLFVRKMQQAYYSGYQGVLILEVNAKDFLSSFTAYRGNESGYYIRFNNTKKTYGCTPLSDIKSIDNNTVKNGDMISEDSDEYPVTVVSQMPLHKDLYTLPAIRMSALLIIMTFVQLIVLQKLIKYIFGKINVQITEMDKIIVNEFSGRIQVAARDELSLVGQRYNLLLDKIDTLIDDIVQKETDSKNAQLKALQYQINPHFIYNILSIFAGNAEHSGNASLSEAISYFGHLLRYNIRETGLYSTVGEELANAKSLIKVYSLHFKGKLQLNIEAAETLQKQKLMKYLLQPIIENSIMHAYPAEYDGDNMQIDISVSIFEDKLILTVRDNGVGMDAKRLHQVRENIEYGTALNPDVKPDSSSIGLHNVYKRIKLIYGEKSNLEITSFESKGTIVITTLHLTKEMEKPL